MTTDHTTPNGHPAPSKSPAATAETDPTMLALGRAVAKALRRIDTVDKNVAQLGADVSRITALLARPGPATAAPGDPEEADDAAPPAVRSWLLAAEPEQAAADLADLIDWLDRVYLRYPGVELPGCWLWHPHVIEELWWLRRAHADAFHREDGSWLRVGDWHDRQRPAVAKRVRDAIGGCDLTLHVDGQRHAHAPPLAPLAAHAAQVAAAWTTTGTRPAPSTAQLAEADAYTEALYRTQR